MNHPTIEKLADEACEIWRSDDKMSRQALLVKLDEAHTTAYLFACFDGQVCNGGFSQWVCNGYALHARETSMILGFIGTDNAKKAKTMVDKLSRHLDFNAKNEGCFGDYWLNSDYEEQIEIEMSEYDDEYYTFNEALRDEVEEHLARKVLGTWIA